MVLSYQSLKKIIGGVNPMIRSAIPLTDEHVQPSSLDVPIANHCYRVSVSSAPKNGESVASLIEKFSMYDFEVKEEGSLLERGGTYILPLAVELELSSEFRAIFSSKSTTGRNGLFARNLSDANSNLDLTVFGYRGKLYVEVSPLRFHTTIYPWRPITQLRIASRNSVPLSTEELSILHSEYGIVRDENGKPTEAVISDNALYLHLDLKGERAGYQSVVNLEDSVHLGMKEIDERENFWQPVRLNMDGDTVLHPPTFYLFATKERICIPPNVCAFMEDYSANLGEFSSHEAGFFDSYFGEERGTQGVLEIHPNRMPIRFWQGRPVCRMVFYKTDEVPTKLYGASAGSHYVGSGPSLAKNYKNYREW